MTSYLLLGTNMGDRRENLAKASALLALRVGKVLQMSALYETAAWGLVDQAPFLNLAIAIETNLSPALLLHNIKSIEQEIGRTETIHWGPRLIDIDILLCDSEVLDTPTLQIPHPYLAQRRFALLPLAEIAPGLLHPIAGVIIQTMLDQCEDVSEVKRLT